MTSLKPGEIHKYLMTGGLFEVRQVTNEFIILCARDETSLVITGRRSFDFLFAKATPGESSAEKLNSQSTQPFLGGGLAR